MLNDLVKAQGKSGRKCTLFLLARPTVLGELSSTFGNDPKCPYKMSLVITQWQVCYRKRRKELL